MWPEGAAGSWVQRKGGRWWGLRPRRRLREGPTAVQLRRSAHDVCPDVPLLSSTHHPPLEAKNIGLVNTLSPSSLNRKAAEDSCGGGERGVQSACGISRVCGPREALLPRGEPSARLLRQTALPTAACWRSTPETLSTRRLGPCNAALVWGKTSASATRTVRGPGPLVKTRAFVP